MIPRQQPLHKGNLVESVAFIQVVPYHTRFHAGWNRHQAISQLCKLLVLVALAFLQDVILDLGPLR